MINSQTADVIEVSSSEGDVIDANQNNMKKKPSADSNTCFGRSMFKLMSVFRWVLDDFTLKHLMWIKLVFLFQSASMTVLYPYLNLHMKSLGISVQEAAIINALVPILFIFTPPLAGFMADRLGNFRILLSLLTALGGLVSLLLLLIPPSRNMSPYPSVLEWGLRCGKPDNRARFQKLMLHGFKSDECDIISPSFINVSFTPGTCGYLCPARKKQRNQFYEYKVVWPNRGGGFGISEIVDIVTLDSDEARIYHMPSVVDNYVFFPMNWTFHLSCDRIRPNDCIFNPIRRAPSRKIYSIQALATSSDLQHLSREGPDFDVASITPPDTGRPVTVPINCGAKEVVAQVISTPSEETEETDRYSGCVLDCMVNVPRGQICQNTEADVVYRPAVTFWSYLLARTFLGVLTASSLMMFEGAVMATIQELGGDYGIQRFVGNFGAIVFAPLGGYLIDVTSDKRPRFDVAIYIYLGLKLLAAAMILFIDLDFRPPGERILKNLKQVMKNTEVIVFLVQMMFAGTFWGYIEAFLFWYLDDLGAGKFLMGWTVAIGMITSLPFLVFSGPITDLIGHINVIIVGMLAYFIRLIGYSFLENPVFVYPYEALEGFTMALMMTSAVTYVAKISSPSTLASVMGIMGALFFGVGKGTGSLFGGTLMSFIGARNTFRYFAANALLCAIFYVFFQCCYARPADRERSRSMSKVEEGQHRNGHPTVPLPPVPESTEGNGSETGSPQSGLPNKAFQSAENIESDYASTTASGPRSLTGGTRV